jgi:hypothetical protein
MGHTFLFFRRMGDDPSGDFFFGVDVVAVQRASLQFALDFIVAIRPSQVKSTRVESREPEAGSRLRSRAKDGGAPRLAAHGSPLAK